MSTVRQMCKSSFSGYWELDHLPYSGGFFEQPADELEWILEIIDCMNEAISAKKEKDDK